MLTILPRHSRMQRLLPATSTMQTSLSLSFSLSLYTSLVGWQISGKGPTTENYFVLNTGDIILAIGPSTWQSGGDLCIEAVKIALKVGYLYGNEVEVGEALAEAFKGGLMRENLFLTSKLRFPTNSHKRVANSVRVSLESLGVSYLDLYLVHWLESSAMGDATDPP